MRPAFVLAVLALATAAVAHQGVQNPAVLARMEAMSRMSDVLETIGGMAKGGIPFDEERALASRMALEDALARTPGVFETPETDPRSEARPEIWNNWDDFVALNAATLDAARTIDVSSAGGLSAGLIALGRACSACHDRYRIEN